MNWLKQFNYCKYNIFYYSSFKECLFIVSKIINNLSFIYINLYNIGGYILGMAIRGGIIILSNTN